MTNPPSDEDFDALLLLAEYDQLQRRLRTIEPLLRKAAAGYGRRRGMWGFGVNQLRSSVERERAAREGEAA